MCGFPSQMCTAPQLRCTSWPLAHVPLRPKRPRRDQPAPGAQAVYAFLGSARPTGTSPWLQFWLQFTGVRVIRGEFIFPGQDGSEPE